MKQRLLRLAPPRLAAAWRSWRAGFPGRYAAKSYAQEGEDLILWRLMEGQRAGFYVDVGAHHPIRFSNTYLFYVLGWSGINLDATPGSMSLFQRFRPRDINLEVAIGQPGGDGVLALFDEAALNTFDPAMALRYEASGYRRIGEQKLAKRPLGEVLRAHLPAQRSVDFLSVDVEGMDLEVLQSNDWRLCRPKYILVESLGLDVRGALSSDLHAYLAGQHYDLYAKTANTLIFRLSTPC